MSRSRDLSDTLQDVLVGCAKFVFYVGGLAALISIALLVFTIFKVNSDATLTVAQVADASRNVGLFQGVLIVGLLGLAVGSGYLWWGSEFLGLGQVALGALLYFSPLYLPSVLGDKNSGEVTQKAYSDLQSGGLAIGVIGILIIIVEVAMRVSERAKQGAKADHLKYGKGIKEETDKQNVFLGKCWQLPFCRKFVREKCPIYHAKTSCWKELVGCMCEESVIRGAMENKPIPKDAVLAASMIPRNNKLTIPQKKERCYNCIIFNEHLRHQYKVAMWTTVPGFLLVYGVLHGPLYALVDGIILKINDIVNKGTMGSGGKTPPPQFFVEAMLGVVMLIALTYTLKVIEVFFFSKRKNT